MNTLIANLLEPWADDHAFDDPSDREIGRLSIVILLILCTCTLLWLPLTFLIFDSTEGVFFANLTSFLIWGFAAVAYWRIKKGKVLQGAFIIAFSIFVGVSLVVAATGVTESGGLLFIYSIPLAIIAIAWGRIGLILFAAASLTVVAILVVLDLGVHYHHYIALDEPIEIFVTFVFPFLLLLLLLDRYHTSLKQALVASIERGAHLLEAQKTLDTQIAERSNELEATLARLQEQENELQARLHDLELARTHLQERSPILPVLPRLLVVPLIGELSPDRSLKLHEHVLQTCHQRHAHTVIFDLTGLAQLDQAACQSLLELARAIQMIGTTLVMAGLRADMADTMVENDFDRSSISMFSTLQEAISQQLFK